jgi:hypothetical protein
MAAACRRERDLRDEEDPKVNFLEQAEEELTHGVSPGAVQAAHQPAATSTSHPDGQGQDQSSQR